MALWIDVSTSKRRLKLLDDNREVKRYPIAVGKILTPTPTGMFTIINKQPNPPDKVFGVLWMGLSKPGYGIHGTNDPSSIGKFVSKGCIRMYNKDVLDLSTRVSIGTKVYIHR